MDKTYQPKVISISSSIPLHIRNELCRLAQERGIKTVQDVYDESYMPIGYPPYYKHWPQTQSAPHYYPTSLTKYLGRRIKYCEKPSDLDGAPPTTWLRPADYIGKYPCLPLRTNVGNPPYPCYAIEHVDDIEAEYRLCVIDGTIIAQYRRKTSSSGLPFELPEELIRDIQLSIYNGIIDLFHSKSKGILINKCLPPYGFYFLGSDYEAQLDFLIKGWARTLYPLSKRLELDQC